MGKLLIVNGSPRAPRSNSKKYIEIFLRYFKEDYEIYNVTENKHSAIYDKLKDYSRILFVFPLYADSLPASLMRFMAGVDSSKILPGTVMGVIINCGFLEPEQNNAALKIMEIFVNSVGGIWGTRLAIGSGEAILTTPFKFLVVRKIRKFAKAFKQNKPVCSYVTMPISKKMFLKASTVYWVNYGKKNRITKKQMDTMVIQEISKS